MCRKESWFYFDKAEGPKDKEVDIRYTNCIVLVEENFEIPEQSIFALGESRCSDKDNYDKNKGKQIAEGRARSVDCKYTEVFKLSDALLMETYEDGPVKDGVVQAQCSVTTPMSLDPIPYGVVNRLRTLLSANAP